jgi:hypothetical protein
VSHILSYQESEGVEQEQEQEQEQDAASISETIQAGNFLNILEFSFSIGIFDFILKRV